MLAVTEQPRWSKPREASSNDSVPILFGLLTVGLGLLAGAVALWRRTPAEGRSRAPFRIAAVVLLFPAIWALVIALGVFLYPL